MHPCLKDYALRSHEILGCVASDQIGFHASCAGAGIKGQEPNIYLGGCSLDKHVDGNLENIAIAASVLSGKGNRPLWTTSSHPQSTRTAPSLRNQYISLIANSLYPGGGGPFGRRVDEGKYQTAIREELHSIALVGRLRGVWPPYVNPSFDMNDLEKTRRLVYVLDETEEHGAEVVLANGEEEDEDEGEEDEGQEEEDEEEEEEEDEMDEVIEEEDEEQEDEEFNLVHRPKKRGKGRGSTGGPPVGRKSVARTAHLQEIKAASSDDAFEDSSKRVSTSGRKANKPSVLSSSKESLESSGRAGGRSAVKANVYASGNKKGRGGSAQGKAKQAKAKKKGGGAAGKRKVSPASSGEAKGPRKKTGSVPRANETAEDKRLRLAAMESVIAEKDKKWGGLFQTRGEKESSQGERADRKKGPGDAWEDALKSAVAKRGALKSPSTGPPTTGSGDGASVRPAEGLEQHGGSSTSQPPASATMHHAETRPPSTTQAEVWSTHRGRSGSRSGRRGGSEMHRSQSRDRGRGRHRGGSYYTTGSSQSPSSGYGRHGSRSRHGGGTSWGVPHHYSRSPSRSRPNHYAGGQDHEERRQWGGHQPYRYSRSPSRSYHSRHPGSSRDSRDRPYPGFSRDSRDRPYHARGSDSRDERCREERSRDRQCGDSRDSSIDFRGRQGSSARRGGDGGRGWNPSQSPPRGSRQQPPRPRSPRSESPRQVPSRETHLGSGVPPATAGTARAPSDHASEGDEALARLGEANQRLRTTPTVGSLRGVVDAERHVRSSRAGKEQQYLTKCLQHVGIPYTTMKRWNREVAAMHRYEDSYPLHKARSEIPSQVKR